MKKEVKGAKKTTKKVTTKKEKTNKKKGLLAKENKLKSSRFTLILTVIAILAALGCVYIDYLSDVYYKMPLYAILLFIILVEDKK